MSEVPLLEARRIVRRVHDGAQCFTILDDVSLTVQAGERVALLGPSGSGKSTLLHILGALDRDYGGSVEVLGRALETMRDRELAAFRNSTFGFVFQAYNLLGQLTVLENVLLPARFSWSRRDEHRAREVLEAVGLGDKLQRRPRTLSGGERQRVAIARALYNRPKLLLCDEPTGNLDSQTAADVLSFFDTLAASDVALLIATHDDAIATGADRVVHLQAGKMVG